MLAVRIEILSSLCEAGAPNTSLDRDYWRAMADTTLSQDLFRMANVKTSR